MIVLIYYKVVVYFIIIVLVHVNVLVRDDQSQYTFQCFIVTTMWSYEYMAIKLSYLKNEFFCICCPEMYSGLEKFVYRLIVMFLSTEIFSKRRKIYAWAEEKPEWITKQQFQLHTWNSPCYNVVSLHPKSTHKDNNYFLNALSRISLHTLNYYNRSIQFNMNQLMNLYSKYVHISK